MKCIVARLWMAGMIVGAVTAVGGVVPRTFETRTLGLQREPVPTVRRATAAGPGEEGYGITVNPEVSYGYDSSAFDDYTEKADWYLDGKVTALKAFSPGDALRVSPLLLAEWFRYNKFNELDFDMAGGGVVADYGVSESVKAELSEVSLWLFKRGFDDNFLTLHEVSGSLAKSWKLTGHAWLCHNASVDLAGEVKRRFSDADTAERWTFAVQPSWSKKISDTTSATLGGEATYGVYDSPSDRDFWQFKAGASVHRGLWKSAHCSGEIVGDVSYLVNDDTTVAEGVAVGDYEKWELRPTLSVALTW